MHQIVLFGEILADIFPDQTVLGGAPYNVARHLRAFQQQPTLISKVGNDTLKKQFFTALSALDINLSGIQIGSTYPTGQVTVTVQDKAHRFDICPNQAYDYINAKEAASTAIASNPSMLYYGTLAQRADASSTALNSILSHISAPRFVDINLRAPWYNKAIIEYSLRHADYVKVSEEELVIVTALLTPEINHLQAAALSLINQFNLTALFVTCGENGAWALSSAGKFVQVSAKALGTSLVDTVGAGDAFSAVCILGVLYQWPIEETVKKANDFAAEICKLRGATPTTHDVYRPFI